MKQTKFAPFILTAVLIVGTTDSHDDDMRIHYELPHSPFAPQQVKASVEAVVSGGLSAAWGRFPWGKRSW